MTPTPTRPRPRRGLPVTAALVMLTLILLVGGAATLTGVVASLSLSASTDGEVVDAEPRGDRTRVSNCYVRASYVVDGRVLEVAGFRHTACPKTGSAITVRYDPAYPPQAELGDLPVAPFVVAAGFGAGFVLSAALLVRRLRRRPGRVFSRGGHLV